MTTINLYQNPEERQQKISARTANSGFFFSLGILICTILAFVGLKFYVSTIAKQNDVMLNEINQQNTTLAGVSNLQHVLDMQARLAQIKGNLQIKNEAVGKLKITDVLNHLGTDLSSDVTISSYSYTDGEIKVAFVSNDFNGIARQISNFKKSTYFSNANLVDVVRGQKNITADMTMEIKS